MLGTNIISLDFIKNNKVGTQCGTVGNACLSQPDVIEFLEKFVEKIEIADYYDFKPEDEEQKIEKIEGNVYAIPTVNITFKEHSTITDKEDKRFKKLYKESYDCDFKDDYDYKQNSIEYKHTLLGNALMLLVNEFGGSLRFEEGDIEQIDNREFYFETE